MLRRFRNQTTAGNERAVRRGTAVPRDAVNLAYYKTPTLNPHDNIVIVDTSRVLEENGLNPLNRRKIYYANALGILVDTEGNTVIGDQFPAVTDVFSVKEDFSMVAGSEYTDSMILPYVHVSRHFHVDAAGLTPGSGAHVYEDQSIKVVDSTGKEYLNRDGTRRYQIMLVPAKIPSSESGTSWAYRVHAYVDTDENEHLHLIYNKVEVNVDGEMRRQEISYREILNPQPVFDYRPEESEVVDPSNRRKRIYSTKLISEKNHVTGRPTASADGYQVYVPRKAISDPRIFQPFRWRATCTFTRAYKVDPTREHVVKCGVVITNKDYDTHNVPSRAVFAFLNLQRSQYNVNNVKFHNPHQANHSDRDQENVHYWFVNADTESFDDYDLLLWAPNTNEFDFTSYRAKINNFTNNRGTIFIDTNNFCKASGLGPSFSHPVVPNTGQSLLDGSTTTSSKVEFDGPGSLTTPYSDHELFNGLTQLGGWDIDTESTLAPTEGYAPLGVHYKLADGTNAIRIDNGPTWVKITSSEQLTEVDRVYGEAIPYGTSIDPSRFIMPDGTTVRNVPVYFGEGGIREFPDLSGTPRGRAVAPLGVLYELLDGTMAIRIEEGPIWIKITGPYQLEEAQRVYGPSVEYGTNIQESRFLLPDGSVRDVPAYFGEGGIREFPDLSGTPGSRLPRPSELDTMSWIQSVYDPGYCHRMSIELPERFRPLINGKDSETGGPRPVTIIKDTTGGGHEIMTTLGQSLTCSAYLSDSPPARIVNQNWISVRATSPFLFPNVKSLDYVNSPYVAGAMKFMFNVAMLAVKNKTLDVGISDEQTYSTTWSYSSPWEASWVIDGNVYDPALTKQERDLYQFTLAPRDLHADPPDLKMVYKRKLSEQTLGEIIDQALEPLMNDPVTRSLIEGSVRTYKLETTNINVKQPSVFIQTDYPYAWTDVHSPKLVIPSDFGPFVIKEEERMARFNDKATYRHRQYPDKPYACQVVATHVNTESDEAGISVQWTAYGTAKEKVTVSEGTAPTTGATQEVQLTWWNNPKSGSREWRDSGNPDIGMKKPTGIHTWQEHNYNSALSLWGPGHLNWPYYGLRGGVKKGDSNEKVSFIQAAINAFIKWGYLSNVSRLTVDGRYGDATKAAVLKLQQQCDARFKDGVVDAETWFLIGSQIIRGKNKFSEITIRDSDYTRFFKLPQKYMAWENISNGDPYTVFGKASWSSGGPSEIWDLFMVTFDDEYKMHGVTIEPFIPQDSGAQTMLVRSIDVRNTAEFGLNGYDADKGLLTYMPHKPSDGQKLYIPFGPKRGDSIIIGVGQKNGAGAGWGTARTFGIRDIKVHTSVTTTIPGTQPITELRPVSLLTKGTASVTAFTPVTLQIHAESPTGRPISDVKWTSVSTGNPQVTATITESGRVTLYHEIVNDVSNEQSTAGRQFPHDASVSAPYYAMTPEGQVHIGQETGFISKIDNIKLLCDANGNPVGFPTMPTEVGENDFQRHYTTISLATQGTAAEVAVAFYDRAQKEFIRSKSGKPEMTYIEYILRGPQNIYIGIVSDYELATTKNIPLPSEDDAPALPFKWVMPVYGVYTKDQSRINLQPLPKNLGALDMWPIAVREGRFTRNVTIPTRGNLPLYLQSYRGAELRAYYGLPEAEAGGYSSVLHGPPHADVRDEEPIILDDNVIQVRQAPIHMVQEPTEYPGQADPVRPAFTVYKRDSHTEPWVQLEWPDIKDWNVSTGEIILRRPLQSNDPSLLRVSYTTTRRHYYFKKDEDTLLNLNLYPGHSRQFKDKALYVYIVPEYVETVPKDVTTGFTRRIVPGSVNAQALHITTDPSMFDPLDPMYDPLVVQLGVIYSSAALSPDSVSILDTRRRGGGIPDSTRLEEVVRLVKQASTYWDVGFGAGASYQKGGYVIIRLPAELKEDFSEHELMTVIKRNIAAGVGFKIEDLQGGDWS